MSVRIMVGHVLDKLAELPDESVHMVWTSVPYWGLRSYGTEPQVWGDQDCKTVGFPANGLPTPHDWAATEQGSNRGGSGAPTDKNNRGEDYGRGASRGAFCRRCQAWRGEHGLEPTFDLWLAHEVEIWRAIRRVLRSDGTAWINVGDAYASSVNGRPAAEIEDDDRTFRDKPVSTAQGIFKPKDRILMPARLAIALHGDGLWLRDEIIWAKRNPMPSSVRDRTTPAHEMIYMLSKAPKYFYDQVATAEPITTDPRENYPARAKITGRGQQGAAAARGNDRDKSGGFPINGTTRNKRSVWHLALEPYSGSHFATAPTGIVRPCILAGTSAKGVCPGCGAPWRRETETTYRKNRPSAGNDPRSRAEDKFAQANNSSGWRGNNLLADHQTTGWSPGCECPDNEPVPATILDPFGGVGTTALVAEELGRDCILIELNPESAEDARARIRGAMGRVTGMPERPADDGLPLFGAPA